MYLRNIDSTLRNTRNKIQIANYQYYKLDKEHSKNNKEYFY